MKDVKNYRGGGVHMKRFAKLLIATMMVMAMGVTAMAAPSPSLKYTFNSAKDKDGNAIELTVIAPSEIITDVDAVKTLGLAAGTDVSVLVQDITAPADAVFPLTVTLNVAGVTSSSKVYGLHYENGAWVKVAVKAGAKTVTFTVDSLSTFAVVVEGSATKSPQTGTQGTAMAVMMAVISMGVIAVVSRRKTI